MVFLILIVVSFFVFRNSILQQAIEKASTKIEQSTTAIYPYETLDGLSTEITLVPKNADTLFSVQK
jgi:hypothetical protein